MLPRPDPASSATSSAAARQGSGNTPHGDVLQRLIDIGEDLARILHEQTLQKPETVATAIPAFGTLSRAVRRTVLLARHIADTPGACAKRTLARKQVVRAIDDAIDRNAKPRDADALRQEALDRLDTPEFDEEWALRPLPDLIAEIRRDLGLEPTMPFTTPYRRRTAEDLAQLHTWATRPAQAATPHLRPTRFRGK